MASKKDTAIPFDGTSDRIDARVVATWHDVYPKCGSENCARFAESDAPSDGVNMICEDCGELFRVDD